MRKIAYIAFLRAINVGGHTVIMERLRGLFVELGLAQVRTFIQTGNVFFETEEADRSALARTIEIHLEKELGYAVPVILTTVEELEDALSGDPFAGVEQGDDVRLCVAFISEPFPDSTEFPVLSPKGDMELLSARIGAVFAVTRFVAGKVGNLTAFIEKRFGVRTTVRFYPTALKILKAAQDTDAS